MKDVGILTFHCADNYGAMLQAYGLKYYLREKAVEADIISYEPFFMTGRHWWIPYGPSKNIIQLFEFGLYGWMANLKKGKSFFDRRAGMRRFRKRYLVERGQKRLFFTYQLKRLPYQYYIVGSDQIWNPDITFGLRRAYFGAFKNRNKRKVIAYAASLGGTSLSERYRKKFSELIRYVDVVSVREKGAIPYIKQFYSGDILTALDPVFLLKKEEWKRIEKLPDKRNYILVYVTEKNDGLFAYAKALAKARGLSLIEIENRIDTGESAFFVDDTAGPSEFLGYIHQADYVLTNSFHAIAFSIIYQKKFMAFQHSALGERIDNILELCELKSRLCQKCRNVEIDAEINWEKVGKLLKKNMRAAEDFLRKNVGADKKGIE